MRSFLNDLDYYIPSLLNKRTLNIIMRNVIQDINGVMLVGNEYGILNRIAQLIVKCLFDVETIWIRPCPFNPDKEGEGEYYLSDYHMEFDLNEKALEFIKTIVNNKSISKRQFVFIIKNAEPSVNKNLFLALRRIMDINPSAKFIITTSSTSFMEKSLMSRVLRAHCSFPFENILQTDLLSKALQTKTKQELHDIYLQSECNIISLLQHVSNNYSELLWQQNIDKLLDNMKKEKQHYNIVMLIRDTVYKLFHIGVPLKDICRYIIKVLCSDNTKNKHLHSIVAMASECEHEVTQSNKDILLYEKLFLHIYKYI